MSETHLDYRCEACDHEFKAVYFNSPTTCIRCGKQRAVRVTSTARLTPTRVIIRWHRESRDDGAPLDEQAEDLLHRLTAAGYAILRVDDEAVERAIAAMKASWDAAVEIDETTDFDESWRADVRAVLTALQETPHG